MERADGHLDTVGAQFIVISIVAVLTQLSPLVAITLPVAGETTQS
jgi:hypothetical protein